MREKGKATLFCRIYGVSCFVRFRNFAKYPTENAAGNIAVGDGFCHNASNADNRVVSDGNAGQHRCPGTDPNVIPYDNGLGNFHAGPTYVGVNGVFGRRETAIGRDEHMVTESDCGTVGNHHALIRIEGIADADVIPVIASERRQNAGFLSHAPKQIFENLARFFFVVR